ncbi:MAG TPA: acetyltransferase [Noviherbaspirillum sp.]|nr:acetyltransferase [Noviherbaspirillum sp.]
MAHFDVFNGDADGLCALHQLRLAAPCDATLITGTKRDIALLERVSAQTADSVTVLDVSIDVNRTALLALLERGVSVHYFDHHGSGEVPAHAGLQAFIDTAPDVCTGLIVDRWLGGAYPLWAVVAAFGDNLAQAARKRAAPLALRAAQISALQTLGECLNYNAYGDSEADLLIHPAVLYEKLHRYAEPFSFIQAEPILQTLRDARRHDLGKAQQAKPYASLPHGDVVILPDAAWSRRVRGNYGNFLVTRYPQRAHAVLTPNKRGGYTASIRAPLTVMRGADRLCQLFPEGGGRPAAGGINHLPRDNLAAFVDAFKQAWPI